MNEIQEKMRQFVNVRKIDRIEAAHPELSRINHQ